MTMNSDARPAAFDRAATLETTRSYMGSLMSFLTLGAEAGGRFALIELQAKPGSEPPPHIHLWENEIIYVLDGAMDLYCGDSIMHLHAHDSAFIPAGQPHGFYIRSPEIRALGMIQSVDDRAVALDRFFTEMSVPAISMDLPDHAITYQAIDPAHVVEAAGRHGMRILSPEEAALELPLYPGFGRAPPIEPDRVPAASPLSHPLAVFGGDLPNGAPL